MKIASSILAAMMAFMLMSVSCTDETPDFVVPGPGTGQTNNGGNSNNNNNGNGGGQQEQTPASLCRAIYGKESTME